MYTRNQGVFLKYVLQLILIFFSPAAIYCPDPIRTHNTNSSLYEYVKVAGATSQITSPMIVHSGTDDRWIPRAKGH